VRPITSRMIPSAARMRNRNGPMTIGATYPELDPATHALAEAARSTSGHPRLRRRLSRVTARR
jgi:hypothetical protein